MRPARSIEGIRESRSSSEIRLFIDDDEHSDLGLQSGAENFKKYLKHDIKTLDEIFNKAVQNFGSSNFLGRFINNEIVYSSYSEVNKHANNIASNLVLNGIENSQSTKIGIYAENSYELRLFYQAVYKTKMIIVSTYSALGTKDIIDVFVKASSSVIYCNDNSKLRILLENKSKLANLKTIICNFDPSEVQCSDLKIINQDELIKVPQSEVELTQPKPEDMAILFSTSGSTGNPKIVVHTHSTLFNGTYGTAIKFIPMIKALQKDNLPLIIYGTALEQHILGFNAAVTLTMHGGSIVYPSSKDLKSVFMKDLLVIKPTIWCVVPFLFNRIQKQIMLKLEDVSFMKKAAFNAAYNLSVRGVKFFDFVFKPIVDMLGGRMKYVVCAGALLDEQLYNYIQTVTGIHIIQGYGLTEGLAVLQSLNKKKYSCGTCMNGMEIKLVDVPKMNYYTSKRCGEILIRGKNVFQGYYNDKEETNNAFDKDGYFITGDIGRVDKNNAITIIDRKKDIFKLAQGEYICPSKIQEAYKSYIPLKDVYVHGENQKSFLVAIGFFELSSIAAWCKNNFSDCNFGEDLSLQEAEKILNSAPAYKFLCNDLESTARDYNLKGFEMVKAWHFKCEIPTVENKLLTSTLKHKRFAFEERFSKEFENLYAKCGI